MIPQQTIAHYRIGARLGEGGMGEVWRATDTKLGREVAIKVIPEAFAQDADRMARFTREAQVLASLNHPNIAAIHGVEERAIVMELVEGQTLSGPLPLEEALPVIHQLIDALEYAHEKGVIHRDLKPANIKVTPEGRLKVLDFGLAKAMSEDAPAGDRTASPTLTMRATVAGMIMGTAAYMAPEQARGHNVDKRADIWAFGVVVYELLTGKQLFDAPTVSDILAAVLTREPNLDTVPPKFRRLLRLCLARDPRQRLRDISGARILLEDEPAAPQAAKPQSRVWMALAAAGLLGAAVLGVDRYRQKPAEAPPLLFDLSLPPKVVPIVIMFGSPVISPEGSALLFVGSDTNLWVRRFTEGEWHAVPGTKGARSPFWSPDGRWVAFFSG